jgi:hypothetical protein
MRSPNFGNKPYDTKIKLATNSDFLEVYIPPYGFRPVILIMCCFGIFWNGFIAVWTFGVAQAPFPINVPFILFSIPFWFIGGSIFYICLFCLFGKTYLRIDRHQISLVKTLFDRKVSRQRLAPRREIHKLVFTRKHFYRDADGDRVESAAELKFEIGTQSIVLGGTGGGIEHEAEVEWLAYEIGEWLDKPLTIIEFPHL